MRDARLRAGGRGGGAARRRPRAGRPPRRRAPPGRAPGIPGKLEPGEDAAAGLARELAEELGIAVHASEPLIRVRHRYPERAVELHVRRVIAWDGTPHWAEGQPVEWLGPAQLDAARFPDANRPVVAALQLPACSPVTASQDDPGDAALEQLVAVTEATLAQGPRLVRLRAASLGADAWQRWRTGSRRWSRASPRAACSRTRRPSGPTACPPAWACT
ncbi:MAG: NUDIX domain-containing protein [Halofilum sp. (in: g-proteobacteria)]|nr:NUDIX domain-containing protein [Halofilum sp. (in: g-proteobacteria)]